MCSACTGGKCVDPPSEMEPVYVDGIPCPSCGGGDETCKSCQGRGEMMLTGCPGKLITPEIIGVIQSADFARKGCLPYSGGVMDQPAALMEAINLFWSWEQTFRRKAGLKD